MANQYINKVISVSYTPLDVYKRQVLGGLAVFTKFTSGAQNMVGIGAGLILVGASIKIFASAIGDLGSLDPGQLVQGLTGMGVALAEIAIALKVMPKNTIAVGAGLRCV